MINDILRICAGSCIQSIEKLKIKDHTVPLNRTRAVSARVNLALLISGDESIPAVSERGRSTSDEYTILLQIMSE